MCKSSSHALPPSSSSTPSRRRRSPSSAAAASTSRAATAATASSSSTSSSSGPRHTATTTSSSSSRSSRSSLAAARASLPSAPLLYTFQELTAATNNFLSNRADASCPSSAYWRCSLRGRDAALFQHRALPGLTPHAASAEVARTARYHHASLAPLLGACLAGSHAYLAYRVPPGAATLTACLRQSSSSRAAAGSKDGGFLLGAWLSRVQVAADVAQGLDYVHTHAKDSHGRITTSTVLLVPDGIHGPRASLTHFVASGGARIATE